MKHPCVILLAVMAIELSAADIPIVFVHGHKSEADAEAGISTWYPMRDESLEYQTTMTKILADQYRGYRAGLTSDGQLALECNENTQLQSMPDAKRVYNFAWYHSGDEPGVIGFSGENALVYVKYNGGISLRLFRVGPR